MTIPAQQTVYTKTAKGILELRNKTARLSRELAAVFQSVDGKATIGELLPKSGMTAQQLNQALGALVSDGYIKTVAAQAPHAAGDDTQVEFDAGATASRLHMEAATHALAGVEAGKLAQQEARAALDAKLRAESEGRARALAEARAQSEAQARVVAQAAARAAANARAQAEQDAAHAPDAAARVEAQSRMRAAGAAEVRAKAESDARGEAEARARALVDEKAAAEKLARDEAEKHAAAEGQAQALVAAESRAQYALQAHSEALANARGQADSAAVRVQLDEHEDAADRARAETKALATARAAPAVTPASDTPFSDLAQELTARVHSERRARDEVERQSRSDSDTDAGGRSSTNTFPSLQFAPEADDPPSPGRNEQSTPGPDAGLPTISLASGTGRGDVKHTSPDHVPSALERAMMARVAQADAESAGNGGAVSPAPRPASAPTAPVRNAAPVAPTAPAPELTLAAETGRTPYPGAEPPAYPPAPPPALSAVDESDMPTLEDPDPAHERLNVDRTAHDLIAEAAVKSRAADVLALSHQAIDLRRQRQEDDARRAELVAREKKRRQASRALGIAAVAVPVFAVAWLQFMPLNGYLPEAQKSLSDRLNQPTTISTLRYVLLPTPRLVLEGVRIGAAQGIHVERVEAHAWPTTFIAGPLAFDLVEASGVSIDPGMLGLIPTWTGGRSAGAVHSARLKLTDVKLTGKDTQVEGLSGEVSFQPNGTVRQAVLNNENLKLEIAPQQNGVRVALTANDWRAPFGPAFPFGHLTLEGIADKQQFATTTLSARIGGGDLTGTLAARWEGPLIVGGEFKLQGARLDDLAAPVSPDFRAKGVLSASGRYAMQADSASGLMDKALLDATFSVVRGELTGIDLVRAVQGGGSALNGGRTAFDQLTGSVQLSGGQYGYRNLQLSSGPLDAAGYVDVGPGGRLGGRVNAGLSSRSARMAQGTYTVSGTVKDPKLVR